MSFKEFIRELEGSRVEGTLIKTFIVSLIASTFTFFILYFMFLQQYLDLSRHGFFLFFTLLSFALIIPAVRQVRAYHSFTCMGGMMIGMTAGMLAGFLTGFYIGATNGMFIGSLAGMAAGILFGVWLGSCCGIMGFLEGIMAGFMGGLMGAMTSVMLFNDHLRAATVIIFLIRSVILIGLKYMIYLETRELK